MNRKLLSFDIDGTLAMPGNPPTEAVVKAIRKARGNGHLVFLSTGRPEWLVDAKIKEIGFDGGIFHAGGRAAVGNRTILDQCMPGDVVNFALDCLRKEKDLYFMLECAETCYRRNPEPFFAAAERMRGGSTELRRLMQALLDPSFMDEGNYNGQSVYKISYFTTNRAQMEQISAILNRRGKAVSFENMMPDEEMCSGEVTAHGTDKGTALDAICRYFGASVKDAVAFGDSMNDAEMIEAAGMGVAMGKAEPRLKAVADRICESVEEDGVAREMERLGLI